MSCRRTFVRLRLINFTFCVKGPLQLPKIGILGYFQGLVAPAGHTPVGKTRLDVKCALSYALN